MEGILAKLQKLSESDFYPYHMPGHKRFGNSAFSLDITEIDGFDNLHHATGMLKDAQERAAKLYGAEDSYFLVNGSTCGILTAIFSSFKRGDKVIVARNCHKAVYHGLELRGIEPIYLYPDRIEDYDINNGIRPKQVKDLLEKEDRMPLKGESCDPGIHVKDAHIKGMILTSPTYEGYVSRIKEIAEILHERGMILIVDEAHGAHFGFQGAFPESAVKQGADLVIQSLHKTLPSMTQTALLHRCTQTVAQDKIRKYLGVFQTSSPSYVFMAYMDECISLLENRGNELFVEFNERLEDFYNKCDVLKNIRVVRPVKTSEGRVLSDPGKIIIGVAAGMSGKALYDILRTEFHLQPEMYAGNYVLAIMTVCDTQEGFDRLYEALLHTDDRITEENNDKIPIKESVGYDGADRDIREAMALLYCKQPKRKFLPGEVEEQERECVDFAACAGRISGEYIYLYPPGIPFIVPGEKIDEEMLQAMQLLKNQGYEIQGPADADGTKLWVMTEV